VLQHQAVTIAEEVRTLRKPAAMLRYVYTAYNVELMNSVENSRYGQLHLICIYYNNAS
jgi:hypothetical protein